MTFTSILVLLLMLSVLVAAHELGHYLVARWFGMDVEEFAIGFGRPKWCYYRNASGTEFTFRPIPLGGFVRVTGMVPDEEGSEVHVKNGFYSKSPMARFWVLAAGPAFSILFGVLLLLGIYTSVGVDKPNLAPVVGEVSVDGPAAKAGMKAGDRILAVDSVQVKSFYEVLSYVRERPERPLTFDIERDGDRQRLTITPLLDEAPTPVIGPNLELTSERKRQGKIGVRWQFSKQSLALGEALQQSLAAPVMMAKGLIGMLQRPASVKEEVGGPGTIAKFTDSAVSQGFDSVLTLSAILSISLGFMNLLPIPVLDGGQMVVALIELARRGKRLSYSVQSAVSMIGMALVLAMIVGVIFVDVQRLSGR